VLSPYLSAMTRYRFLDGMGEVVAEEEFRDHAEALAWALDDAGPEEEVQRVEYLGAEGGWRWAGALHD
jgi:ribosomal protein S7